MIFRNNVIVSIKTDHLSACTQYHNVTPMIFMSKPLKIEELLYFHGDNVRISRLRLGFISFLLQCKQCMETCICVFIIYVLYILYLSIHALYFYTWVAHSVPAYPLFLFGFSFTLVARPEKSQSRIPCLSAQTLPIKMILILQSFFINCGYITIRTANCDIMKLLTCHKWLEHPPYYWYFNLNNKILIKNFLGFFCHNTSSTVRWGQPNMIWRSGASWVILPQVVWRYCKVRWRRL